MLGQVPIIDDTLALLQAQVGVFLQLRSQLQEMSKSPVLTISDKAAQLMVVQNQLEIELPAAVQKSQSGSVSDYISATGFFLLMEKQIYDASNLRDEYVSLGESAKPTLIGGLPDWALYAGGGAFLLYLLRGRKHRR